MVAPARLSQWPAEPSFPDALKSLLLQRTPVSSQEAYFMILALLLTSSVALSKSLYFSELVFIFHLLEEHLE